MLYVTVHLYGRNGIPGEFKAYEQKALDIFRRHGGEVVVAYTPVAGTDPGDTPDEIQVLRISGRAVFDAFMNDPERVIMAGERDSVLRRTEVFFSETIIGY